MAGGYHGDMAEEDPIKGPAAPQDAEESPAAATDAEGLPTRDCAKCGTPFAMRPTDLPGRPREYCSDTCRDQMKRARRKGEAPKRKRKRKAPPKVKRKTCEKCGRTFLPGGRGRPPKYCSATCLRRATYDRDQERARAAEAAAAEAGDAKAPKRTRPTTRNPPPYLLPAEPEGPPVDEKLASKAVAPVALVPKGPRAYPTTILEFARRFPDDRACSDYLTRLRWPKGITCPKCGSRKMWRIDAWRRWECPKGHQTSITAGTTMHRTKQPLLRWFFAAYLMSTLTPGISALQIQRQLGLPRYETAFQMLHKLRSSLIVPERDKLSGSIEIDEGFFDRSDKGRLKLEESDKATVVVAVEVLRWRERRKDRDGNEKTVNRVRAGRLRLELVPNNQKITLLPWIQATVEEGSTIYTDGHASYLCIEAAGYNHVPVIPTEGDPASYLYMVHLIISNVKTWLQGTFHGSVSKKHLMAYLNEYVFRFNRRFWPGLAFHRALGLTMHAEDWPEYETLYDVGGPDGWVHPHQETDPYNIAC